MYSSNRSTFLKSFGFIEFISDACKAERTILELHFSWFDGLGNVHFRESAPVKIPQG